MKKETGIFKEASGALLHGYSQILFAKDRVLGCCLLLVSFIRPSVGLHGLIAVLAAAILVPLFKLDRRLLVDGFWTFCSAMVGMYIGYMLEPNYVSIIITILGALISLMLTVMLHGWLGALRLPLLTLPFMLTVWVVYTFSIHIKPLVYNPSFINPSISGNPDWLITLDYIVKSYFPGEFASTLFLTFSGIFFSHSDAAGLLILLGILYTSRIAFVCAIAGFTLAFGVYNLFALNTRELTVGLSGANYIFLMISVGSFFLIPNKASFWIASVLSIVLTAFTFFFQHILYYWSLPSFTLAFSVTTIMFLYFIRWQSQYSSLIPVLYQYNQPEKNLYMHLNGLERFNHIRSAIQLPVMGSWFISQGYDGGLTHLEHWKYALDFVIRDDDGQTWNGSGIRPQDYYCYGKPVLAPADGTVVQIINYCEDNPIGEVDLNNNWGNTIIIKHQDGLYSQMSHLKKDSFLVVPGQYVTRGQSVAQVGNSGRSPEPHLHFQMQQIPDLGAHTISFPFNYFIDKNGLHQQDIPAAFEIIRAPEPVVLIQQALKLIPGTKFKLKFRGSVHYWECFTDAWNKTYIYSHTDESVLYYETDGVLFRCNSYVGADDSPLRVFFEALYDVYMEFHSDFSITNNLPVNFSGSTLVGWVQDFIAPFYIFNRKPFSIKAVETDNRNFPTRLVMHSEVGKSGKDGKFQIIFSNNRIEEISNLLNPDIVLCFES